MVVDKAERVQRQRDYEYKDEADAEYVVEVDICCSLQVGKGCVLVSQVEVAKYHDEKRCL